MIKRQINIHVVYLQKQKINLCSSYLKIHKKQVSKDWRLNVHKTYIKNILGQKIPVWYANKIRLILASKNITLMMINELTAKKVQWKQKKGMCH